MAQRKSTASSARASNVRSLAPPSTRIRPPENAAFRLRIGGAWQPREEGFIGIDRHKGDMDSIDHVVDLKTFPWPIDDSCVDTVFAAMYFHRLTTEERWHFMNECGRILGVGSQLMLTMPYWLCKRAITDPLAQWPPLCEESFMVYNRRWRESESMTELPITCDLGATTPEGQAVIHYGHVTDPEVEVRNEEYKNHAKRYWANVVWDLHITLTRQS